MLLSGACLDSRCCDEKWNERLHRVIERDRTEMTDNYNKGKRARRVGVPERHLKYLSNWVKISLISATQRSDIVHILIRFSKS